MTLSQRAPSAILAVHAGRELVLSDRRSPGSQFCFLDVPGVRRLEAAATMPERQ
jgi:hypothetical protein